MRDYKRNMPRNSKIPAKQQDDLASDQKERGYYYDDAHGYERYDPDVVDDDPDDDAKNRAIMDGPGKRIKIDPN